LRWNWSRPPATCNCAFSRGEIDAGLMLHSPSFALPGWSGCGRELVLALPE
jgi:hypothetical protein